jgi:hypothetical protein
MTRKTNARIAGFAFLFYIAAGILSMVLSRRASGGGTGISAKLAGMAQHATEVRLAYLLAFVTVFAALSLGVSLYALTRDEDPDLAMFGMVCRVAEGVVGVSLPSTLILLWLATTTGAGAPDTAAAHAIGAFLLRLEGSTSLIAATLFAVGSTLFCWLLLRGRMIPVPLAWLGVIASALLVVMLPIQLAGFSSGRAFLLMWIPMAAFELIAGPWLIIKGVAAPIRRSA